MGGCSESCAPGLVKCGTTCLAGTAEDQCCLGPTGAGMVCDKTAECCDGVCLAPGTGCSDPCHEGLVRCGGQCLPGNANSLCCEGPTGAGILCQAGSQCCGGLCEALGTPCPLAHLRDE